MPDSHEKITIRSEDLGEAAPSRITIRDTDLATQATPPPRRQPALPAILVDEAPLEASSPVARNLLRAVACLLGLVLLLGAVSAVLYLSWPQPDWIEEVASRADRSVVLIESPPDSLGTGFVVASRGDEHLILTNRHVVSDVENCRVASRVGPAIRARIVGYPKDEEVDLALLLVRIRGLRPVGPIADFRDAHVGEPVVAIGHPLGLDYTVTSGIVSAKRGGLELQTTAAISPGNSGGPLINRNGRVIGVNTRTVDPSEGQSLSFAVRADAVLNAAAWNLEEGVDDFVERIERK